MMKADNFVLTEYIERIRMSSIPTADIAGIAAMMRAQLFSVPFENLDVQLGKGVSLVPENIVAKIIGNRRGGYCYEVNGLFAMALDALSIPYRFVAARPMFYPVRRPRTHMAIVATIDGVSWLFDLGFGSYGIRAPMRLDYLDVPVRQDSDSFLLTRSDDEYVVKASIKEEWVSQYAFDLSRQEWLDFMPSNYLNSTHPDSIFVQKLLIIIQNEGGRNILLGDTLKTITSDKITEFHVSNDDRDRILKEQFNIHSF